jgi:perosamine synthetase
MVTALLDPAWGITKESMIDQLRAQGVDARPFFYPLSTLPAYGGLPISPNPVAQAISPYGLNLPSALILTPEQVDYVCTTFRAIIKDLTSTA